MKILPLLLPIFLLAVGQPGYRSTPGLERKMQMTVMVHLQSGSIDTPGISQSVERQLTVRLQEKQIEDEKDRFIVENQILRLDTSQRIGQNSSSVIGADQVPGLTLAVAMDPLGPVGQPSLVDAEALDGARWSAVKPWLESIRAGLLLGLVRLPAQASQLDGRWTHKRKLPLAMAELPGLTLEVEGAAMLRGQVACVAGSRERCWRIEEEIKLDWTQRAGWASRMIEVKATGSGRASHRLSQAKGLLMASETNLVIALEVRSIFDPSPLPLAGRSKLTLRVRLEPYEPLSR